MLIYSKAFLSTGFGVYWTFHTYLVCCRHITIWWFLATPVSKKPPRPPTAYYPGAMLTVATMDTMMNGDDAWTMWWHEQQWGPTTTTDERQWGPPPCTNADECPAPAHTRCSQDRDDDNMAQRQMMTRLPHDATTPTLNNDTMPTDDMRLGNDNMHEDDDEGHVPLAFYIPLPIIPLPFSIPLLFYSPLPFI